MIIYLILYAFITYGITTIVVYGDIFSSLRNWISKKSEFVHDIFSCPLCFSTWLGFVMSIILQSTGHYSPVNLVFDFPFVIDVFLDGVFTAGIVWLLSNLNTN